ncbi:MAG: FAD-dependent oxidoreductase [Alphaproteobacteria bacterium]|nr:FAD-dependent oxidoreductase [Alphaproteobacteria bacterium]
MAPLASMIVTECDIAIVGAGPAGLSAALSAADAGADIVVVDEYGAPGGQYFRQPHAKFLRINEGVLGTSYQASKRILAAVRGHERIRIRPNTLVWGAFDQGMLEIESNNVCERLASHRTIVATGAYEQPVPFRGWTLPGVTTAGAAQTLLKAQFVMPGRQILMSGTGPFQLPVATQLVKAGAKVVEILEYLGPAAFFRSFPQPWRHLDKLFEAYGYFACLLSRGIPLRYGQMVVEARGDGAVEEADVAPVGIDGRPRLDRIRTLAVDSILTNFGFVPSLQLPRLLGCETRWDEVGGCWVADCDEHQRSSRADVLLAGEVTGMAGHRVAMAEGAIAGLRAAADLGYLTPAAFDARSREPRRRRARHQSFADHLKRTFAPHPGIYQSILDDTVVCRCEEVTAGQVRGLAREWNGSLRAIKQCTRAGMGQCQGRICEPTIARLAAAASNRTISEIGSDTPRPHIKPLAIGALTEPLPQR